MLVDDYWLIGDGEYFWNKRGTATAFGLRRQSESGDGAFARAGDVEIAKCFRPLESGVALRFPPQSKIVLCADFIFVSFVCFVVKLFLEI
jgi:hypothetical protein